MGDEMKNLNQQILNFDYEQNFKDQDFYVSKSNEYSFKLLNSWPNISFIKRQQKRRKKNPTKIQRKKERKM